MIISLGLIMIFYFSKRFPDYFQNLEAEIGIRKYDKSLIADLNVEKVKIELFARTY